MSLRTPLSAVVAAALVAAIGSASAQDEPSEPPPMPPQEPPAFVPPDILAQRRKGPAEPEAYAAIGRGLDWLRRHRQEEGLWSSDAFSKRCDGTACEGPGQEGHAVGVTGLALLAFLGAGEVPGDGEAGAFTRTSLERLRQLQTKDGCFVARIPEDWIYDHAAATMAVAEAAWLTGDSGTRESAARGATFLLDAQNPYLAWRYGIRDGDNDTSCTIWCALALRTCRFAGVTEDRAWETGVRSWIDKMTEPELGKVGYQERGGPDARYGLLDPHTGHLVRNPQARFPTDRGSGLTVGAVLVRTLTGDAHDVPWIELGVQHARAHPPTQLLGAGVLDLHYLLHSGLLDVQRPLSTPRPKEPEARAAWRSWRQMVVGGVVGKQLRPEDGCTAGSWYPGYDPFGVVGGRVYSTAMAVLALQSPNRFPDVWDEKQKQTRRPRSQR